MIRGKKNRRKEEITKNRYNRISPFYDLLEKIGESHLSPWREKLLQRVRGKILEVGIGTGKNLLHYPPRSDVTGLDIAEKMLTRARKRAASLGITVQFVEGDVQRLPFPDACFDTVVATFVFCSVPDPVEGLKELRRVAKYDGKILLLEHVRIDKPILGAIMDFLNPFIVRMMGANINRHTVENVRKAGLMIEEIEDLGPMGIVKMIVANPDKQAKILFANRGNHLKT